MRLALIVVLAALPALAQERPVPRPGGVEVTRNATDAAALASAQRLRPAPRPEGKVLIMSDRPARPAAEPAVPASPRPVLRLDAGERAARAMGAALSAPRPRIDVEGNVRRSGRPETRPEITLALARRLERREGAAGGGLCGRASIGGTAISPVPGPGACGIPEAVRITAVSGMALSRPSRMDCTTARALDDWVRTGVIPIIGGRGGGAVQLQVAAGYACRTRNSQRGARVSEHGKGRAIDISGIRLANGETISVLNDWNKGADGRMLAALWRAACGPFGTVLGPNADRFHRDHFHFDTARYRSGSYCR